MKQLLLKSGLAMLLALPLYANAQSWNFGVEAGYVSNTLAVDEYKSTSGNGFKVGADAELTLPNHLSFESGLAYIRKGATITGENIHSARIISIKFAEMNYLQLPLMIGYKFEAGNGLSIKPQAGGYFAVGINGDSFVTGINNFNQPYEARVNTFSGTESNYGAVPFRPTHRADAGLSFALNLNYRHVTLKAEYDLGLVTSTIYGNGRQRTLSISLAYWVF